MEFVWRVMALAGLLLEARCGDVAWLASVDPAELHVPVGSNVTVRCTLLPAAPAGMTARDIVWMYRARELPPSDVTVVDGRTSAVALRDLRPTDRGDGGGSPLLDGERLMCLRRRAPGERKHTLLRSVDITVEWLPCPPSVFTCYMLDQNSVNCSWLSGDCKESHRNKYKLKYMFVNAMCDVPVSWQNLSPRAPLGSVDCSRIGASDAYHCQIDKLRLSLSISCWMWVESANVLGSANSKMRCMRLWDIVKPSPPQNLHARDSRSPSPGLELSWEPPGRLPPTIYPMQYEVELAVSDSPRPRTEVVPTGTASSYSIDDVEECSVYTARVRGHGHGREGFWSEWSAPVTHAVGELNPPSKGPDIWRVLVDNNTEDKREVIVLWEPLSRADARCYVQDYVLSITTSGRMEVLAIGNVSSYRLSLGPQQHNLTVAARNSVGRSNDNIALKIPARAYQGPPPSQVSARPDASGTLLVSWEVPGVAEGQPSPQGYLVEWANVSSPGLGRVRWRRVELAATNATLADNFQDYVRYRVSVYASYQQGEGNGSSTYAYMKQGAPVAAPRNVLTHKCSAVSCDVRWDPVTLDHLNGFLTHYAVYHRRSSSDEPPRRVLVPCASPVEATCVSSYRLENLEPNTEYELQVAAVTVAGEGPRSLTSKAVTGFREFFFIMMLIAGLLLLCGGIITCICIVIVPARTKHIFFHKVPDPKNCSWARNIDFSKPETLQGFLKITLSPLPDLREMEMFSEITIDSSWKLQGHLLEKALGFDGGYTTAPPANAPSIQGPGTASVGETAKAMPVASFPSRALPLHAKLLALEQLRASPARAMPTGAQPPAPSRDEPGRPGGGDGGGDDGGGSPDAAPPARRGPDAHAYENGDVKAATVAPPRSAGGGGGGPASSLPAAARPFGLQQNNNSSARRAASPRERPATCADAGGGAGSAGGGASDCRADSPGAAARTGLCEILMPCGVFSYQPQDHVYRLPPEGHLHRRAALTDVHGMDNSAR